MYLAIKNLSKKYNKNIVLENINLNVEKGEIISIVGSSGCGKTTLLKCIAGLCRLDKGKISINSKPVQSIEANNRNIGFVFQESPLLPHLNVLENILLNLKKYDKEKLTFLLKKIQISDLKKRYPYELSGGENQRVAVARSLIREPSLFLLDEPFSNLDVRNKKHTRELIFEIIKKTNTTTLIVNHDLHDSLEISDRILVLENGRNKMFDTTYKVYSEPKSLEIARIFGDINHLKINGESIYFRPSEVDIVKQSEITAQVIKSVFLGTVYKIIAKINLIKIIIFHNKELEKDKLIKIKIRKNLKKYFD